MAINREKMTTPTLPSYVRPMSPKVWNRLWKDSPVLLCHRRAGKVASRSPAKIIGVTLADFLVQAQGSSKTIKIPRKSGWTPEYWLEELDEEFRWDIPITTESIDTIRVRPKETKTNPRTKTTVLRYALQVPGQDKGIDVQVDLRWDGSTHIELV